MSGQMTWEEQGQAQEAFRRHCLLISRWPQMGFRFIWGPQKELSRSLPTREECVCQQADGVGQRVLSSSGSVQAPSNGEAWMEGSRLSPWGDPPPQNRMCKRAERKQLHQECP